MARQFSNPFPPARPRRAPKRVLSQASVAGDAHEQRAADEVAAAVLAVDRWFEKGGVSSPDIDLTDSSMAAVEAAEARAAELGIASTRLTAGRVIVRLMSRPASTEPDQD